MEREQADAAGRIIIEAQREAAARRKGRIEATGRRISWGFSLLGFVVACIIAPGFGGSRLAWSILGAATGRIAGWFVQRAWLRRMGIE